MKILIKLVAILVLCSSVSNGQTTNQGAAAKMRMPERRGYISIGGGGAIPVGDFGSTELSNEKAGLAETGFNYNLSFGYRLGKSIGIGAVARSTSNDIDLGILGFGQLALNASPWRTNSLLGGFYFPFHLENGNVFHLRLFFGASEVRSPELELQLSIPGATYYYKQPSVTSTTFAFDAGMGFQFRLSDALSLLIDLDYYNSQPEFELDYVNDSGNLITQKFIQPVSIFIAGAGIGFRL